MFLGVCNQRTLFYYALFCDALGKEVSWANLVFWFCAPNRTFHRGWLIHRTICSWLKASWRQISGPTLALSFGHIRLVVVHPS